MLRVRQELGDISNGSEFGEVLITSQTVNSPLFELFECDICSWGSNIEIQSAFVLERLVGWRIELLRPMVVGGPPLRIDSCNLADHFAIKCLWRF